MKQKYEELQKKYDLPQYEEMVSEFDIDTIGKDDNVIRETVKKMFEKIDFYSRTMESLVQPDSTYGTMKEASSLSLTEQVLMKKLFIELMYLTRQFTLHGLEYKEEESAKFINYIYVQWKSLKPELKIILQKMMEAWKKKNETEHDGGYFG